MDYLSNIGEDFKYKFMRDIRMIDIVFVVILVATLVIALLSEKIAKRFKSTEKEILHLSVKIKTVALIFTAILAMIITQVF